MFVEAKFDVLVLSESNPTGKDGCEFVCESKDVKCDQDSKGRSSVNGESGNETVWWNGRKCIKANVSESKVW